MGEKYIFDIHFFIFNITGKELKNNEN